MLKKNYKSLNTELESKVCPQRKQIQNPNPVIVFTAWQCLNKKTIKNWTVFPHKRLQLKK